jgi:hypothetical protein
MDKRRFPWFLGLLGAVVLSFAIVQPGSRNPAAVVPVLFIVFPTVFSLSFFRRPYSLLGTKKRWPESGSFGGSRSLSPVLVGKWFFHANSYGIVQTFPDGLFLRILLAGSGFLRFDEITEIESRFLTHHITHTSPAFRSPIDLALNKEALKHLEGRGFEVKSMKKKTKAVGCVMALIMVIFLAVGTFVISFDERPGAFSPHRDHAVIIENGVIETVYDLDLASGKKTRLERNWGGFPPRRVRVWGYPDPGYLKELDPREGEAVLRYNGRTLTQGSRGALSPDERYLAYASTEDSFILRDLQSEGPPLLTVPASPYFIEWSSDGQFVLVCLSAEDDPKCRVYDLQGQLRWSQRGRSPSWGPGQNEVSLLVGKDEETLEVYELSADTPKRSQQVGWVEFKWQPGGQKILYRQRGVLYLASQDFSDPIKICKTDWWLDFEWSPSGAHFVVESRGFAYFNSQGELLHNYGLRGNLP